MFAVTPALPMQPYGLRPLLTAHLFPQLAAKLLELLRSLEPADWDKQTIAPKWRVRHVAAHLLDTQLRKLSMVRDGYFSEAPASQSHADVRAFVDRMNAEGVAVYSRLSPQLLISLLEHASREFCEHIRSLNPFEPALFPVSWAGEAESLNWFDIARELTEHWHHQQQIRLATGREGIMTPELYHPVLETFMHALPFCYRAVRAQEDALVRIAVSGDCGGEWNLIRTPAGWRLIASTSGQESARVEVPQAIAW